MGAASAIAGASGGGDAIPLHEQFRAAAAEAWDAMQAHRFVRDIEADRLPPEALLRYLSFESDFVETALLIFGHAMLKAPGFAQRRALIAVLRGLAEDQVPYFERSFRALGARPAPRGDFPPQVAIFRDGMLAVAERGAYEDILATMLAAEWTYATWCARAARGAISDPVLREWVRVHAQEPFLAGVAWLRAEIDRAGEGLSAPRKAHAAACFRRALELEIGFHDAPYVAP